MTTKQLELQVLELTRKLQTIETLFVTLMKQNERYIDAKLKEVKK